MTITRIKPGARLSAGVAHNNTLYVAGQVANDKHGSIEKQTQETLANIEAILAEAGTTKSKVLSVQVLLNNIADFAAMNSVYDAWIDPANKPARACYEARLADPALKVEIICVAALD